MEELQATPKDVTIRLSYGEIDLLLNALNEALEAIEDWEFSTRTGFEKSDFRTMQVSLRTIRDRREQGK